MRLMQEEVDKYLEMEPIKLGGNAINLSGQIFGKLTVIKPIQREIRHNQCQGIIYLCFCNCGNYTKVSGGALRNNNTMSCGCYKIEQNNIRRWIGTKDISGSYFASLKGRNKLKFNITIKYIQKLLEKQQYKCALTGLDIKCTRNRRKKSSTYEEQTASLDRIDSSKGYIKGNVQWVHKDINYMKQEYPQEYFVKICKLVAANN